MLCQVAMVTTHSSGQQHPQATGAETAGSPPLPLSTQAVRWQQNANLFASRKKGSLSEPSINQSQTAEVTAIVSCLASLCFSFLGHTFLVFSSKTIALLALTRTQPGCVRKALSVDPWGEKCCWTRYEWHAVCRDSSLPDSR